MQKIIALLVVVLLIGAPIGYMVHLYRNYEAIQTDSHERSARIIAASVDSKSVSEIGYIFGMRRENHIRDGYRNLVWFIAVPATGERFSCAYDSGFDDFKVGDGVTLIHNTKNPDEAETGYIVGLHDKREGRVAEVGTNDLDDLMMEDPDD